MGTANGSFIHVTVSRNSDKMLILSVLYRHGFRLDSTTNSLHYRLPGRRTMLNQVEMLEIRSNEPSVSLCGQVRASKS
jgi:hypothetical protein